MKKASRASATFLFTAASLAITLFSMPTMAERIAIIGTGQVAGALGPEFAQLGHTFVYGSRDPSRDDVRALVDRTGVVLSEDARITTQMRLIGPDLLEARFAIDDPTAFTDTWHVVKEFERMPPGTRIFEFACAENNRNPIDSSGRTLTLDAEGNVLDQL